MTEIYLHFKFAHYGLYRNAPVVVDAKVKSNRGNINTLSEGKWLMATNWYLVTLRR